MGAFDFTWNAIQSDQIGDHDDRIEELEKKVELLYEWVMYLKEQNDSKS
jgi:hypothetical protein